MIMEGRGTGGPSAGDPECYVLRPRNYAGGTRCVVYAHPINGTFRDLLFLLLGQHRLTDYYGLPIIVTDLIGAANFGNDGSQSAVTDAWNYMITKYGCLSDKFLALCSSMGHYVMLNYMANNTGKIAAYAGILPVPDMTALYNANPTIGTPAQPAQTWINNAYGGSNATWLAARPTHDPALRTATITTGRQSAPIAIWRPTDDPLSTVSVTDTFFTNIGGATITSQGAVGHSYTGYSPDAMADALGPYKTP